MANQKINKWTYPNELANYERCRIANFELYMNQPNYKLGDQYLWVSILYCFGLVFIVVLFIFCSYVLLLVVFFFLLFEMVIPNSYSIFNSIAIFHCFPSLLYQKTDFVLFNRFLFQPTFSRLNVLFQLSPSMHLQLKLLACTNLTLLSPFKEDTTGFRNYRSIEWLYSVVLSLSRFHLEYGFFFFKFFYFSDQQW